jgi:hypothetical protein
MIHAHALFFSTHHALWAEQVLAGAGIAAKVVPVPRHLSSDCGYCVRFAAVEAARAEALLRAAKVELDRVAVDSPRT